MAKRREIMVKTMYLTNKSEESTDSSGFLLNAFFKSLDLAVLGGNKLNYNEFCLIQQFTAVLTA